MQRKDTQLRLFDPDHHRVVFHTVGQHPVRGNAVIGVGLSHPLVHVETRGGHDRIFFPENVSAEDVRVYGALILSALSPQDYVSGLFVDETRLGRMPGALSIRHLGWGTVSSGPAPAIVVGFKSYYTGCSSLIHCTATVANTTAGKWRPVHGALNRAATSTFIAARGPDFRRNFSTFAPASSADVARTIANLLQVPVDRRLLPGGRVLLEALLGHEEEGATFGRHRVVASAPMADGTVTEVHFQEVGTAKYFAAAGFPGLTIGVPERRVAQPVRRTGEGFWSKVKPKPLEIEIRPD